MYNLLTKNNIKYQIKSYDEISEKRNSYCIDIIRLVILNHIILVHFIIKKDIKLIS